jgi:hypothetical protein
MTVSKEELLKQLRIELHKPVRKRFPTRNVFVPHIDHTWGMDLVDMSKLARFNGGFRWMLTIIDCWSRYAWSVPIKTKKGEPVLHAFQQVLSSSARKPKFIWVDEGGEFYNKGMTQFLDEQGITRYSTYGKGKSVMVERFNRTLKTQMWKEFTEFQTNNWIDGLDKLMEWYNFKPHRGIDGRSPYSISRWPKRVELCIDPKPAAFLKPRFKVRDVVRVSRWKGIFEKGYTMNWSQEQFIIARIRESKCSDPPMYYLMDWYHRPIKRGVYNEELQLVKYPWIYLVEKVLKRDDAKNKMLVKWIGFDATHNEWIPISNVVAVIKK